mmetsp:Transcript_15391/g.46047  ORF Transcript_15391/g.46047 Transcript_15391/m.46047 type:complete len:239 (-) Transcript_15391:180-896(-)
MLGEVALDELFCLLGREAEEDVQLVHVATVETDRVLGLGLQIAEGQKVVGQLGRAGHLACALQTEQQYVQQEAVVLHNERTELQATNQPVGVGVRHVLERELDVVLGGHVVSDVVVKHQTQQQIQQSQIHLLVQAVELRLQHHHARAIRRVPRLVQVVDALTPLVDQEGWRLGVGRLHPVREQMSLVRLVPQVLIQVGVGDLLQGINVIHGRQMTVHVHELDVHLLEGTLREQVTLDA